MHQSLLIVTLVQKIWSLLEGWDTALFFLVNSKWTNDFLNSVFPWWREPNTWIPLYLFLVIFALMNFKQKAIPWILFVLVTLTITDQVSSSIVKNWFQRIRPCNDPFLAGRVRLLLDKCGAGYSFTSSHAVNHFGFATFIFISLRTVIKKWGYVLFFWAATVSYAQVYVGVHYPLDVICGGLLGCGIGYCTGIYFNRRIGLMIPDAA